MTLPLHYRYITVTLPLPCLQHKVCQHHRCVLAAWVDAHQRGAQCLRRVELADDEVQPRQREGGLLVRVVVLERLLVRGARLLRGWGWGRGQG